MKSRRFIVHLLLLILLIQPSKAQQIIDFYPNKDIFHLIGNFEILSLYEEKPIQDALKEKSQLWTSIQHTNILKFGFSEKVHWIRWKMRRWSKNKNEYLLQINNKGINKIELFLIEKDKIFSLGKSGDYYPFSKVIYASNYNVFPIPIPQADTVEFVLFVDKKNENLRFSIDLIKENVFRKLEEKSFISMGIIIGVLLIGSVICFYVHSVLRENLYLWYGLYLLSVIYLLLAYDRLDFQFFYPNLPFLTNISRYISGCLTLVLMVHVMQLFCNQNPQNSKIHHTNNLLKYVLCFWIPLTVVIYWTNGSVVIKMIHFYGFIILIIVSILSILISCVEQMLHLYKPAVFYFLAIVAQLIMGFITPFLELGILNYSTRTPNLMQISFIIEVLFITMGIIYRYRDTEMQKNELSLNLSEEKINSIRKQLDIQASEQERIAEDLHDLLGGELAVIKIKIKDYVSNQTHQNSLLKLIDEVTLSTRKIAYGLVPIKLNNHNLLDVIKLHMAQLSHKNKIHYKFSYFGELIELKKEMEVGLYKITIEVLQNIEKHSEADEASLQIFFKNNFVEFLFEDNGKGFEKNYSEGMGLQNIRKRIKIMKGNLHIDSQKGNTTIIITIPV